MADRNQTATVGALMLIAGGIIGAGLGLLFAPQSGKKTRRQITRYAGQVVDDTEELIRDSTRSVNDMVEDLGERTSRLAARGGDVAEDWRKTFLNTLDRGQKSLERQRRKLSDLWS